MKLKPQEPIQPYGQEVQPFFEIKHTPKNMKVFHIVMQYDTVICLEDIQACIGTAERTLELKYKVILGTVVELFVV